MPSRRVGQTAAALFDFFTGSCLYYSCALPATDSPTAARTNDPRTNPPQPRRAHKDASVVRMLRDTSSSKVHWRVGKSLAILAERFACTARLRLRRQSHSSLNSTKKTGFCVCERKCIFLMERQSVCVKRWLVDSPAPLLSGFPDGKGSHLRDLNLDDES